MGYFCCCFLYWIEFILLKRRQVFFKRVHASKSYIVNTYICTYIDILFFLLVSMLFWLHPISKKTDDLQKIRRCQEKNNFFFKWRRKRRLSTYKWYECTYAYPYVVFLKNFFLGFFFVFVLALDGLFLCMNTFCK